MAASRCSRSARRLALLMLLSSRGLAAEPARHAELNALLGSGNMLGRAPVEPAFWEGLGSLRSGRGNRARFDGSLREPGIVRDFEASVRLRLELGLDRIGEGSSPTLGDASSFVQLAWRSNGGARLSLRAYPLDTDYVRIGYLHALDWGGTQVAARESVFLARRPGAPGILLALESSRLRLFAGAKWSAAGDALPGSRRRWGAFGGGSLRLAAALRFELGLGFFEREAGFVEGASARWVLHRDATEPELAAEPFRAPPLRDDPERLDAEAPRGAALALEGTLLVVRAPNQPKLATAPAAALYGSVRGAVVAAHLAITCRSLAFVLRNDARYAAESYAAAESAPEQPELAAWLGGSARLHRTELVPSFEVGVRLPATLFTPSSLPGLAQVWVASGTAGLTPLPLGTGRLPLWAARLALRWQASASVALLLSGDYQRDPNRTRLRPSGSEIVRASDAASTFEIVSGFQARW